MSQRDTRRDFIFRDQIDSDAVVSEDLSLEEGAPHTSRHQAETGKNCFYFDR